MAVSIGREVLGSERIGQARRKWDGCRKKEQATRGVFPAVFSLFKEYLFVVPREDICNAVLNEKNIEYCPNHVILEKTKCEFDTKM